MSKTKYINVKDLAKIVPFSPATIRKLCREGKIPHKKLGSEYYFDPKHFEISQ